MVIIKLTELTQLILYIPRQILWMILFSLYFIAPEMQLYFGILIWNKVFDDGREGQNARDYNTTYTKKLIPSSDDLGFERGFEEFNNRI